MKHIAQFLAAACLAATAAHAAETPRFDPVLDADPFAMACMLAKPPVDTAG